MYLGFCNFYDPKAVLVYTMFFLSLSRFLIIQFPDFYDKWFKRKLIIANIIAYDILIWCFNTISGYFYFYIFIYKNYVPITSLVSKDLMSFLLFETIIIGFRSLLLMIGFVMSMSTAIRILYRLKIQVFLLY